MDRDYLAEAFRIADAAAQEAASLLNPSIKPLRTLLLAERAHVVALVAELRRKEALLDKARRISSGVLAELEDLDASLVSAKAKLDAVGFDSVVLDNIEVDR